MRRQNSAGCRAVRVKPLYKNTLPGTVLFSWGILEEIAAGVQLTEKWAN
jgi:hypothetical protein